MSKPTRRDKTRPKPPSIPIATYIKKLAAGGVYTPSRRVLLLHAAGDESGAVIQAGIESARGAESAMRHARALRHKREGNSKYFPNGGLR